ncbi:MAG: DEAD/DEAH box helicase family protein [Verrucomicrobia bacterium]|nr:DEAD/DEAH box helicase family protein [Verrucomicrobiota bacterium]
MREYQAETVIKAVSLLNEGKNTEVCCPPGTGKTLIGQMVLSVWHDHADARVLCVVPNTNLLQQHFDMSNWAYQARLWEPLKVDAKWRSRRSFSHDSDLQNARV